FPNAQEVFAVRQKSRPSMAEACTRRSRGLHGCPAFGRYAEKRAVQRRLEEDDAVAIPRSAATLRRIAKRLNRSTGGSDFVQLAIGEVRDVLAVGREKRIRRSLCAWERN